MKKRKIKVRLTAMLLLLATTTGISQTEGFRYRRALGPVTAGWRQIAVPDAVFGKAAPGLADLRILGVSGGGDTLETPYIIRATSKVEAVQRVPFKTLNTTHNAQGYYYTFEVPDSQTVNEIVLELDNRNFDWRVQLEGSADQSEWFGILDDYRILDIDNAQTRFRFTQLRFPPVRYRYLRLRIKGSEAPQRLRAGLSKTDTTAVGPFRTYQPQNVRRTEDKAAKQTVVTWSLPLPVPVSELHIPVLDSTDYYRPVRIEALTDSFKTPDGWRYQWTPFDAGTLHSLAPGDLSFEERVLQQLRLLESQGYTGVWVDTFRKKYWQSLPGLSEPVVPDATILDTLNEIYTLKGSPKTGCFDLIAHRDDHFVFAELKRQGKDQIRPGQIEWLQAAQKANLNNPTFFDCRVGLQGINFRKQGLTPLVDFLFLKKLSWCCLVEERPNVCSLRNTQLPNGRFVT